MRKHLGSRATQFIIFDKCCRNGAYRLDAVGLYLNLLDLPETKQML